MTNPTDMLGEHDGRTFDRLVRYDDRSREYPIRGLFRKLDADEPRSYTWACEPHLDQGPDGACVGYSIAHEIAAKPRVHPTDNKLAEKIYRNAQKIDPWAGEDYEGTSVLAGMKVAQQLGYFTGYHWAFTLNDILVGVSRKGPGILGCWWWEGMMDTDEDGFVHPTGERVGGHAIMVNQVNVKGEYVRLHQSWGDQWGRAGDAFLTFADLEKLLLDDGEFALPVRA